MIRVSACQTSIPLRWSIRSRRQLGCFFHFATRMAFHLIYHQGKQRCSWSSRVVVPSRCASSILDHPLRMPSWWWGKQALAKFGQWGITRIWAVLSTTVQTTGRSKPGGELGLRSKPFLSTDVTCYTMINCRQASGWSCSRR